MSHGYDDVEHQVLWDAVQNDVPALLATIEQMLKELESPPPSSSKRVAREGAAEYPPS